MWRHHPLPPTSFSSIFQCLNVFHISCRNFPKGETPVIVYGFSRSVTDPLKSTWWFFKWLIILCRNPEPPFTFCFQSFCSFGHWFLFHSLSVRLWIIRALKRRLTEGMQKRTLCYRFLVKSTNDNTLWQSSNKTKVTPKEPDCEILYPQKTVKSGEDEEWHP